MLSSRGFSWHRDQRCVSDVSCIDKQILYHWRHLGSPWLRVINPLIRTRDQIALCWIMEKPREFQKNIYFYFIDYAKGFDCVDHNKLWKILKEVGIPDHLTCLLRNLYAGQEATVRTGQGTTDWFQYKNYQNLSMIQFGVSFSMLEINRLASCVD